MNFAYKPSSKRHRRLGQLTVLCAALLWGATARGQAQQVKPYVMLLFDTSGSMTWPVCYSNSLSTNWLYGAINGDNSKDCPGNQMPCTPSCGSLYVPGCGCNTLGCGNGLLDDSRLYKVKQGAYSVVNAFGEVTFGLSRFHNAPYSFTCDATNQWRVGGWVGVACGALGQSGNQADILVNFSDTNQTEVLSWMNNCDDYPSAGSCPGTTAPSSGCSLCSDCGGGCDKELRGVGVTPIAGSLYDLRVNYFNGTVLPADTKKACRPYKVILLTDGLQSSNCPGAPATEAANLYNNSTKSIPVHVVGFGDSSLKANLDAIAKAGGTSAAVVVSDEVSLALAMASIISESLLVETCNGKDDNCDDQCDEDWPEVAVTGAACQNKHAAKTCTAGLGICQKTGVYVCKSTGLGSECNAVPGQPNPLGEICGNGLDDDCDGLVDEGCTPTCVPQVEICDGKDNDCDKLVDEGYVSVACGSNIGECKPGTTICDSTGKVVCQGAKGPSTEICDGKDNNCDTVVDNISEPCYPATSGCDLTTGLCTGVCAIGSRLCQSAVWGPCLGYTGPTSETCNGLDDNCNGQVDENVGNTCTNFSTCASYVTCSPCPQTPLEICDTLDNDCNGVADDNAVGAGLPCGVAIGECTMGKTACMSGALVCQGGGGATSEVCDNKDNDCNAKIDDNVPGDGAPCGSDVGECKKGTQKCIGGKFYCQGGVLPQAEICDGKDNDCDGVKDNLAVCPGNSKCIEGVCVSACQSGEFPCPGGFMCKEGYCVPSACAKVVCKETERCQADKNGNAVCVPRCQGVSCKTWEVCDAKTGLCKDDSCKTKGCPAGQKCAGYTCVSDPCPPGTCQPHEMCSGGKCYPVCAGIACPEGQVCEKGQCRPRSACEQKICDQGYTCQMVAGQTQCLPDPCSLTTCQAGQVCYLGKCVADPCATVTCPAGFTCKLNAENKPDCQSMAGVDRTRSIMATGGGVGCSVDPGGEAPGGLWLLLLAMALLRRRVGG